MLRTPRAVLFVGVLACVGCSNDESTSGTGGTSAGGSGGGGPGGGGGAPVDLCAGLVTDLDAHPMTPLAQPALGEAVTDAEFGTVIRRITAVSAGTGDR